MLYSPPFNPAEAFTHTLYLSLHRLKGNGMRSPGYIQYRYDPTHDWFDTPSDTLCASSTREREANCVRQDRQGKVQEWTLSLSPMSAQKFIKFFTVVHWHRESSSGHKFQAEFVYLRGLTCFSLVMRVMKDIEGLSIIIVWMPLSFFLSKMLLDFCHKLGINWHTRFKSRSTIMKVARLETNDIIILNETSLT